MYQIRTDIPHGNAALTSLEIEDGIPAVHFAAHPHGGTESLWWCIRLERSKADAPARIRLVWKNLQNCLGLNAQAALLLHPVYRRDGGPWERLSGGAVRDQPDGRSDAVWDVPAPERWAEAAFCFPHGPAEVDDIVRRSGWKHDVIGVSAQGRELVRLANDYGEPGSSRPGVYCLGHQHASEMSGAWVLHGFLTETAALPEAPLTWSVPIAAIDEVVSGDYGKDPFPWDLNRAWGSPAMRPEVHACMRDIALWKKRCRPTLALDFHSPGGKEDDGVYTFLPDPEKDPHGHASCEPWAERIAGGLAEYAAPEFKRVARYPSRFVSDQYSNFTRYCLQSSLPALTFEIPYHRIGERVLQQSDYLEIGSRIARAVAAGIPG